MSATSTPRRESPAVFYVRQWPDETGQLFDDRIGGTAEALRHELDKSPATIVERPFVPLDSPKRFAFARTSWSVSRLKAMQASGDWLTPASLLDPSRDADMMEWLDDGDMIGTRAEALEFVARLNEDSLEESPRWCDWYVVVELGQPCPSALVNVELQANGVGVMRREMQWPVRVVTPTEEERAAYPVNVPETVA